MSHAFQRLCVLIACCALYACSNGRGSVGASAPIDESPPPTIPEPPSDPTPDPDPDPDPEPEPEPEPEPTPVQAGFAGYWSGTVREGDAPSSRTGVAFVDSSGDMHLMVLREGDDSEFALHGNLCCAPKAEQKLGGHRYLETREHDADIAAERTNEGLRGEFAFRRKEYDFTLQPLATYEQSLTVAALAGVYTRTVARGPGPSSSSLSLSIDAEGALTGSHSNGCVYSGNASVPEGRNLVRLSMTLSNCSGPDRRLNGEYRGFGVLLENATAPDGVTREDTFYFSLVGPTWLGAMSVGR